MRKNYSFFNLASLIILLLGVFLLVFLFQSQESTTVQFKDSGLEQAVRDTIGQEEDEIKKSDVDLIQVLDATGYDIENLEEKN